MYCSPETGRFISEDPIGFGGGDNSLYRYVENSPLKYSDPFGLQEGDGSGGDFGTVGDILNQLDSDSQYFKSNLESAARLFEIERLKKIERQKEKEKLLKKLYGNCNPLLQSCKKLKIEKVLCGGE